MWHILRDVFVIALSIAGGILVSLGFIPEQAVAPDVSIPAPIEETFTPSEDTSTETVKPSVAEVDVPAAEEASLLPDKRSLIDDYEKSLREALEALKALQVVQQQPGAASAGLNETVRGAVVNVFCTTAGAGPLHPISASGVVIDPSGIILTNAHVGQYFLFEDYPYKDFISCIVRTGSPAHPAYTAELLFLPPSWIAANAHKIVQNEPTGNGEHDWALLRVTGTISDDSLPSLSYLPLIKGSPPLGSGVLLAAYPAGFLGGITITKELYAASANSTVQKIYTFDSNTADLFSIGGSIVAQQGSSGGAVAQANVSSPSGAALLGLIVTSSITEDTADRELRALSTEYIIRDFESESGWTLADYLGADLNQQRQLFWFTTAPALAQQLIDVLKR